VAQSTVNGATDNPTEVREKEGVSKKGEKEKKRWICGEEKEE